ncbi:hypothetical protein OXX80_001398 [Metschnikowia pulcherrima]
MASTYYDILEVGVNATQDEIKKQYKKLAIKYHPDKTQEKAHHERFLLIQEAYDTLKDEDSRQKYHREHNIGIPTRPASSYSSSRGYSFATDHASFPRRQHARTSYADAPFASSFFDLYQRSSKMYSDHFSRSTRYEAKESEDRASMYEEYARRKAHEEQERRRKQREEEERRREMEESLRRQKQERAQAQAARARQATEAEFAKSRGFGDARSEYEHAKAEAHRRSRDAERHAAEHAYGFAHHHERPAEFIVVDDDETERGSEHGIHHGSQNGTSHGFHEDAHSTSANMYHDGPSESKFETAESGTDSESDDDNDDEDGDEDEDEKDVAAELHEQTYPDGTMDGEEEESTTGVFGDPGSVPPSETADYPEASFASEEPSMSASSHHQPEVVEVAEESDHDAVYDTGPAGKTMDDMTDRSSRARSHSQTYVQQPEIPFDAELKGKQSGPKKPRLANYEGMKSTLHTYFDDVDFSEIRSTLPDYSQKTRKASSSSTAHVPKKARYAEYTDGTSHAETLYTPVNKKYMRKKVSTISVSDLSPDVDDSSLLFSVESPSFKVHQDLTNRDWDVYLVQINDYKRKFTQYRRAVLEYQMGRLGKDEDHHNIIYSDTSCLDVYQSCLFNDVLLMQNFTRALQEFRQTLKEFYVNCETVEKMKSSVG